MFTGSSLPPLGGNVAPRERGFSGGLGRLQSAWFVRVLGSRARRISAHAVRTVAALLALAASSAPLSHAAPFGRNAVITWGEIVDVASGGGQRGPWQQNESRYDYVDDPTVALGVDGAAAVAWVDQGRKDIFFQRYGRDGKPRHKKPVNVSRSPAVFSWLPRLVLSPSQPEEVFILWQEIVFSGGSHGGEIFFARSLDGGATFGPPVNLSNSIGGDGKGRINKEVWHNGSLDLAIDPGGTLLAAWTEYDGPLWFSRSTDRGKSFSKPVRIAGGGDAKPARAPALAAGPEGRVYLAWTLGEDEGADIRVATSTDGGRSFGEPTIVAETKTYSDAPKVAVDRNGTVHIVYAESSGGPFDRQNVRYTRSHDRARTFEPSREISGPSPDSARGAAFPALSLDERDGVHVLWERYPNPHEPPRGLAMASSLDAGRSFTAPALVPGSSGPAGGSNGSAQGLLMRKLAVNGSGAIAVVNSSLRPGEESHVWLLLGEVQGRGSADRRGPSGGS
jgi:hypothetical protein